jgi:uridine phosphorylase
MANHRHGLWGYSGTARGGARELTIQATGIGGPSAVAVLDDLASHGAERVIRVGTCVAIGAEPDAGELVVVAEAIPADGASRALGAHAAVPADRALTEALRAAGPIERSVSLVGADVIGLRAAPAPAPRSPAAAAATVADLETAPLFSLGRRRGIAVASALVVAGHGGEGEAPEARLLSLGALAARALADLARG